MCEVSEAGLPPGSAVFWVSAEFLCSPGGWAAANHCLGTPSRCQDLLLSPLHDRL